MEPTRLDRLSAVLDGLAPAMSVRFAGHILNPQSFEPHEVDGLRLHLLTKGQMQVERPGEECKTLASPAVAVFRNDDRYSLRSLAGDDAVHVLHIDASFQGPAAALLLEAFDRPLLLALRDTAVELSLVVQLIASELADLRCGHPALLARAGEILFIGILRHLLAHPRTSPGLLGGLADPRIARTLVAIHGAPETPWNLEKMAEQAGMSRTAFAVRFREVMNQTPGNYLTRLRLSIADKAVSRGEGLKRAAKLSGYASVSALSRALAHHSATTVGRPASGGYKSVE